MLFNMFYQICIKFTSLQPVHFFIGSPGLPRIPYNLYILRCNNKKKGTRLKARPLFISIDFIRFLFSILFIYRRKLRYGSSH